jgi:hypothetical protein
MGLERNEVMTKIKVRILSVIPVKNEIEVLNLKTGKVFYGKLEHTQSANNFRVGQYLELERSKVKS